jgi:hypothetical protein
MDSESDKRDNHKRKHLLTRCEAHANIQDNLLQSYRQIFLTVESILFAVGIGLLAASFSIEESISSLILSSSVIILSFVGVVLADKGMSIVRARGSYGRAKVFTIAIVFLHNGSAGRHYPGRTPGAT